MNALHLSPFLSPVWERPDMLFARPAPSRYPHARRDRISVDVQPTAPLDLAFHLVSPPQGPRFGGAFSLTTLLSVLEGNSAGCRMLPRQTNLFNADGKGAKFAVLVLMAGGATMPDENGLACATGRLCHGDGGHEGGARRRGG